MVAVAQERDVSMMTATVVALGLVAFAVGWLVGRSGLGSTVSPASLTDRERLFVERMRESALVGVFTTEGDPDRTASPERYEIDSVEKVNDELWRFNATMNCCGITGAMPIAVPLRWAGDTPMIAMTDTTLPGLGTFTVRLFFYEDRYAGTWQHGPRRGQMHGRIERRAVVGP
jgi:hypothetical protein